METPLEPAWPAHLDVGTDTRTWCRARRRPREPSHADHSKFKELQGPFASGEEVTTVCLACPTEAAQQVMGTRHWTWEYTNPKTAASESPQLVGTEQAPNARNGPRKSKGLAPCGS